MALTKRWFVPKTETTYKIDEFFQIIKKHFVDEHMTHEFDRKPSAAEKRHSVVYEFLVRAVRYDVQRVLVGGLTKTAIGTDGRVHVV